MPQENHACARSQWIHGMGVDPRSPANRGWGWGWTPDPRQIGDGDGDGDRPRVPCPGDSTPLSMGLQPACVFRFEPATQLSQSQPVSYCCVLRARVLRARAWRHLSRGTSIAPAGRRAAAAVCTAPKPGARRGLGLY
jgi:hypothetical protein